MTTSAKLIEELMQAHNGHANEGESTYSESAQRLTELEEELSATKKDAAASKSDLFELWKLVNERPADNAGIAENYAKWNGLVYSLSFLQAADKRESAAFNAAVSTEPAKDTGRSIPLTQDQFKDGKVDCEAIAVNLMRLAGIDKHAAREIARLSVEPNHPSLQNGLTFDELTKNSKRWETVLTQVGGAYVNTRKGPNCEFTLKHLYPVSDIMRGSVAQHFAAAVDASIEGSV